jgi:putative aminopeptidase FrvX
VPIDIDLMRDLCAAPGPTGFEAPVQDVVRRRLSAVAASQGDPLGSVWATVGAGQGPQVVATAHVDQIGLLVTYVDEDGFLYFDAVGSVDPQLLPGREVVVHGAGGAVDGVVGRRPTHSIPVAERGKAPEIKEQFIDVGAQGREAALQRVAVGDPITFAPRFLALGDGLFAAPAFDNRGGVYAVLRALELYAAEPGAAALTGLFTVHEETTFMGARSQALRLAPAALIVVDGDFASDTPAVDARKLGGDVRLGAGPVLGRGTGSNAPLFALARDTSRQVGVAVQIKAYGGPTQTDADELMAAGTAATLSLGLPMRYMHSPFEVAAPEDFEGAATLIAALTRRIGEVWKPDFFVPRGEASA